jgi:hypothetical protein
VLGGWARILNWVAHPLGFGFEKGAGFDFVFILTRAVQRVAEWEDFVASLARSLSMAFA